MSLRPLAALSSRVWWGYPAATPGAVAGVTAPPAARRWRYRAADGRRRPIERACSARLGRTGLGAQQGCRVPRAVSIGRPDGRYARIAAVLPKALFEPPTARSTSRLRSRRQRAIERPLVKRQVKQDAVRHGLSPLFVRTKLAFFYPARFVLVRRRQKSLLARATSCLEA